MRLFNILLLASISIAGVAIGQDKSTGQDTPYRSATISGLPARNIGSATMSGRVTSIAANREPSGKLTIFVGAASGGIWKSEDSGTHYRPVFDEQPVQSIGALALDPKNSKNVWAGSGESWVRNSVSIGDGIYKSTDGGETWSDTGLPKSERISQIIVSPKSSDTVYLHILKAPADGKLVLTAPSHKVAGLKQLVSGEPSAYRTHGGKLEIELPPNSHETIDTVLVMKLAPR